jgi:hypothetical protein
LVPNAGTYQQQIVVATNTGLMWLPVDDLLTSGTALPAAPGTPPTGYWMDVARTGGVNSKRPTERLLRSAA